MVELSKENYDAEVLQSELPVVIDMWGPTCAPCKALMPAVHEMEEEFSGKVKFCSVNAKENRPLMIKLKVMGVPAFLFFKGGEQVARLSGGECTVDAIREKTEALL
ncbi:MAG: thioredoxin [Synergistales bacterium]|nr:thioredoxin family protein [Dethiosulfovibrio sp.]NCC96131.1 thioredoxin [Synergistales bacterium]